MVQLNPRPLLDPKPKCKATYGRVLPRFWKDNTIFRLGIPLSFAPTTKDEYETLAQQFQTIVGLFFARKHLYIRASSIEIVPPSESANGLRMITAEITLFHEYELTDEDKTELCDSFIQAANNSGSLGGTYRA